MTEDEKNFFYFKLHDSDNNDVLDGLELLRAATHHSGNVDHEEQNGESEAEKSGNHTNGMVHIIGKSSGLIRLELHVTSFYPNFGNVNLV